LVGYCSNTGDGGKLWLRGVLPKPRFKSMARHQKETENGKGEAILSGEQAAKLLGSSGEE